MLCGFYSSDITAVSNMLMPHICVNKKHHSTGVHDPMYAVAAVFDNGTERVAMAGLDLVVLRDSWVREIRKRVHAMCGIKEHNIMLAASHAHCSGQYALVDDYDEIFSDAPPFIKSLYYDYAMFDDEVYKEHVIRQIANAVYEADRRKEPAEISIGSGFEDKSAFSRILRLKNGKTATFLGKRNENMAAPEDAVDPEVGVVAAWRKDGSLLGCIVNFACHGTALGGWKSSADWIYYLRKTIKAVMGENSNVVFLNGACGNLTQIDYQSPYEMETGEKYARRVGTRVGAEALKVMVSAERGEVSELHVISRRISIPRRQSNGRKLEDALNIVKMHPDLRGFSPWVLARERVLFDYMLKKRPERELELQAIQIGPAVFLSNPAEYFCSGGLAIKAGSNFPYTFVVELANGYCSYVANSKFYDKETGGGYETMLSTLNNMIPQAFDIIRDESIKLSQQLTPGAIIEAPLAQAGSGVPKIGPEND